MDSTSEKMPESLIAEVKKAFDQLISNCTESILSTNNLEVPLFNLIAESKPLLTPAINSENVRVDFPNNQIIININQEPCNEYACSLLNFHRTINIDDMTTFPREFTRELFPDFKANMKLRDIFPATGEIDDDLNIDYHFENENLKLMIKLITNRNTTVGNMWKISKQKKIEYEKAIKNRVSKLKINKRICFFPLVCSRSSVLLGSYLGLNANIINEICARYRFALDILTEIGLQGLDIEDAHVAEMKGSILKIIKSIPEMYQDDSASSRVKMTKERLVTNDISSAEAEEFIAERYRRCLNASRKDSETENEVKIANIIQCEFSNRNRGTRNYMKHIIQLPNCLPPLRTNWKWEKSIPIDDKSIFVNNIIDKNYYWDNYNNEHLDLIKRNACKNEINPQYSLQELKKCQTINYAPSDRYRLELAKNGIHYKTYTANKEYKKEINEKKLAFSLDVDVSDIDKFLISEIPKNKAEPCAGVKKVRQLVLQALQICNSPASDIEIIIEPIMNNLMFNWCSFISAIAAELCTVMKQKVMKDEWIVKRMREWDAYLILKPDREVIFFSIVMPKNVTEVIPEKIARKVDIYSDYSIIEFISTTDIKLLNLVRAESFFISMISQWSRHYGKTFLQGLDDPDVWAMTRLLLLIYLEDKPKTEQIFTLFRYISMEKFSTCKINAKKMLDKIPIDLRSRLQVWAGKKLVNVMCMPNYQAVELENSEIQWKNMINPYTGKIINNPAQLVELYYVGYAINKNAQLQPYFDMELLTKVLEYEMKLHEVDEKWCGLEERENLESYQFHEWSRRANCAAADHLKRYLQRLYGEKMQERLSEKILHRLSRLTWDQVATLKASSLFDPSRGRIPSATGRFTTQRIKVIIATLKKHTLLAETPALSIASVLSWIDNDGGLRADIFKKKQHGGLREVFVLEVRSRILQLVLEEIARAISQDISIETMMHPESKLTMPQTHMYTAAAKKSKYRRNISSSNDAKVWNQGHHVAKFTQFLIRFLPKDFHNLIIGGMKQFLFKRIALPDGVLNYKSKHLSKSYVNPIKSIFWQAYAGKITVPWIRKQETFLRIESGMMQGILHHTSSLYHAAMLMLRNSLWSRMALWYSIDNITTDMVSSDDSARLTDVFSDDPINFEKSVLLAKLDHISIQHFSRLYGIWLSPKSTICATNVVEFNSEFYFQGNIFKPTLKWSLVALPIVVDENLVERQETMNNQITILLEAGSGFRQASETQLAQVYLHYRLLGMGINPLFLEYADLLMSNPNPALGFFLLDPPIIAGFAGFNFNLWRAISSSETLNQIYAHQMRQCRDTSITATGQLTKAIQIRSGCRQKIHELIAEVDNVCPMWQENIEADPSVLYGLSRNLESSLMKIMVKLTSPSIIKSFSRSDCKFRVVAIAAYLIHGHVATVGSNWIPGKNSKMEEIMNRVSLWKIINLEKANVSSLTFTELNVLFPRRSQYCKLDEMIEELNKYHLVDCGSKKMLRCDVRVFKDNPHLLFDLETIVRWKWFGEKLLASKSIADKLWIDYKKLHPWLGDDPFLTLRNSNCYFDNQIQLNNFIQEHSTLARSVHLTGAPVRAKTTRDFIKITIQNNQIPGYTLKKQPGYLENNFDDLQTSIVGILTFPLLNDVKKKKISERLINYPDIWDENSIKPSARKLKLALIQYFLKLSKENSKELSSMMIRNILKISQIAVYGGFIEKSHENPWNGYGEWVGMIADTECRLIIKNFILISVTTDNFLKLHENQSLLVLLLEELGVTACQSLTSEKNFDFKKLEVTHHGIVYENTNLVQNTPVDFDQLHIQVSADTLSLICHDINTRNYFTVVAYKIEPTDFRFSIVLDEEMYILNCWLNNTSLNCTWAEEYLMEMMGNESQEVTNINREEFRLFVKDSLGPVIERAGIKRKIHVFNDCNSGEVPEKLRKSSFNGRNIDDFDFSQVDFTYSSDDDALPELRPRKKVNYNDFCDYLEGNIAKKNVKTTWNAMKNIHKLWNKFVDENMIKLSEEEKILLEQQQRFTSKIAKFIQIIEYYLDLKFYRDDQ